MFKKIVVGNDGSDNSAQALEIALELAKPLGAEIIVAHVWHLPPTAYVGAPYAPLDLTKQMEDTKQKSVEKAKNILEHHDAEARYVELEGNPADAVIELAEKEDADLIVIGSRGLGAVERFVLGSTSERVVRHASCPVLVAR